MANYGSGKSGAGRILFLGKRFYTNKDALAERFGRVFHFPNEWSKSGRNVFLWLIDYHSKIPVNDSRGSLEVSSTPVLSLAMFKSFLAMVASFRPRIVVASGDCYIGLLAWVVARLTGASFVFDIYDKYDEFAGYRKPFGFDLFGFLIRRARLSLFASRALAERLSSLKPGGAIEVAPNGVDAQMFHPMDIRRCREALDLDPGLTLIGYFGGMEPDRGVADLIQAVEILRDGGADIRLLICGKAHPSTPLSHDWIIYRGMITHEQMPLYLNASNVLVVPYRLSEFMDMGASCKIAEYLMCAKPLVSTSTPNLTANFPMQALELGQALCRPEDAADLARAIDYQLHHGALVSIPQHMRWEEIATAAMRAIERSTEDLPIGP